MPIVIFVARRLAAGLVLLLVLSLLIFALLSASPGSPIQSLLGSRTPTPGLIAELTARYHLDEPFLVQYGEWLRGVVHLDFGRSISIQTNAPVSSIMAGRSVLSGELALYAMVLVLLVGVPMGMASGLKRGTPVDRGVSLLATFGISAPAVVLSIALLYVFGLMLGWFPVYGIGSGAAGRLSHLTLPAVALASFLSAIVIRQTRAATLGVTQQDYMTFARLRGLSARRILFRYALRNASLPVITSVGMLLIAALSAAVFVEQVFSLPGIASLLYEAVIQKDVPLVQGLALVTGAFVILVNMLVDLLGLALDPRTRTAAPGGN
ncbi:ABC transporter permease [Streptomyces sp. NPDC059373]